MAIQKREDGVGFIHIPVSVKGLAEPAGHYDALFLIDTGAIDSLAPASELQRAGIRPVGTKTYELADGSRHDYSFGFARIEFMGEITAGRIIFGPEGV